MAFLARTAAAATFFSTGAPNGLIATVSGQSGGKEVETADDFILTSPMAITGATFTGLIPANAQLSDITQVVVEFYQVFPKDSDTVRTPDVPTRVNSPADAALEELDSAAGELTFNETLLADDFTVLNTVADGINPLPNQTTGGEGALTGKEVLVSRPVHDPGLPARRSLLRGPGDDPPQRLVLLALGEQAHHGCGNYADPAGPPDLGAERGPVARLAAGGDRHCRRGTGAHLQRQLLLDGTPSPSRRPSSSSWAEPVSPRWGRRRRRARRSSGGGAR